MRYIKTDSNQVPAPPHRVAGFTLIELLAVIAIIGIIAAMVLGLGSLAARKKHDAVANAVKNKLVLMIENYQSKLGFYPPDNANNVSSVSGAQYEVSTQHNQLLYELIGESQFDSKNTTFFVGFNGTNFPSGDVLAAFGRGGIANSNPDEPHSFYNPLPKPTDYSPSFTNSDGIIFYGLTVPMPLPGSSTQYSFVHYDSSSAFRHNPQTFDLWIEYGDGNDSHGNPIIITNGNW